MTDVQITVRGTHRAEATPERAEVRLRVARDGAEQVVPEVARLAQEVRSTIEPLHGADGPVVDWSSDRIQTWSARPWNQEGEQLPLVHHAQVGVVVEFADFTALGEWLSVVTAIDGVAVDGIGWTLTDAHQDALLAEVRVAAVADARRKAEAYAGALGLGNVAVVAVADAGMLGNGLHPTGGHEGVFAPARMERGGRPDLEMAPRPISVSAEVDARFTAG